MNLGQFLSKLNLYLTDLYRKPENVSPLCCVLSFVPMWWQIYNSNACLNRCVGEQERLLVALPQIVFDLFSSVTIYGSRFLAVIVVMLLLSFSFEFWWSNLWTQRRPILVRHQHVSELLAFKHDKQIWKYATSSCKLAAASVRNDKNAGWSR